MKRIDTPNAVPDKPQYTPCATPGYFSDDIRYPTEFSDEWATIIQEELCNVISWAGFSLPDEGDTPSDTQLRDAIGGATACKSHSTDTGTTATIHKRGIFAGQGRARGQDSAVVASWGSQADGDQSATLAASGGLASGNQSAVIASAGGDSSGSHSAVIACSQTGEFTEASGTDSAVIASTGSKASGSVQSAVIATYESEASGDRSACVAAYSSKASGAVSACLASDASEAAGHRSATLASLACFETGNRSVIIGGLNAELNDDESIGGGYSGTAITKSNANQNIKWKINSRYGRAHFAGDVKVGGNPDDGSGSKVEITASTGAVRADGKVTATSGLEVEFEDKGAGNPDPVTINKVSGRFGEIWVSGTWASGAIRTKTVNCDKVGADSIVLPSVRISPAKAISCGIKEKSTGQFTIWAKNEDVDVDPQSVTWEFIVFNPA